MQSPITHNTTEKERSKSRAKVLSLTRSNPGAWKELIEKTSDCKVPKNEATYSERRTVEDFLSARTLNPLKFTEHANLLLIQDKSKFEKKMNQISQNTSSQFDTTASSITGCSKKVSEKVHKHQFKIAYNNDELRKAN